jgi:hypothetical protein
VKAGGKQRAPPKRLLTFIGLPEVISQKIVRVFFITTAVRTSNPTIYFIVLKRKLYSY